MGGVAPTSTATVYGRRAICWHTGRRPLIRTSPQRSSASAARAAVPRGDGLEERVAALRAAAGNKPILLELQLPDSKLFGRLLEQKALFLQKVRGRHGLGREQLDVPIPARWGDLRLLRFHAEPSKVLAPPSVRRQFSPAGLMACHEPHSNGMHRATLWSVRGRLAAVPYLFVACTCSRLPTSRPVTASRKYAIVHAEPPNNLTPRHVP